jgi:beta-glucosidase
MTAHGLGDLQAVSALALNAGLDMDMVGEGFLTTLKKSLEEGKVTEDAITQAARRVLEAKYKLGLFEDPYRYIDEKRPKTDILTPESRAFARKMAAHSFVLLKNDQNILPLKKNVKIALVGPLANDKNNMLGTWAPTGDPSLSIPILEGLKNVAPSAEISYAKGANITNDPAFAEKINVFGMRADIDSRSPEVMIEEAVANAKNADVVVAVIGEATEMTGEAASRTDISIPEPQMQLVRALVATRKPVAVILMSGRPLTIEELNAMPVSILQVWHPGVEAGNAIADVVFGDYNPSGKLTASWPRNVGQIPIYYSQKNTGRPATEEFAKFKSNYLDAPNNPLFVFGYGLSYTTFEYSDLAISKSKIGMGEAVEVSIKLTNTGNYDGEEVVQLYLHDVVRSITPPLRELKGFKKVMLKKGESRTVKITLTPENLKFYNSSLDFISEAGIFEAFIGSNSDATNKVEFELTD